MIARQRGMVGLAGAKRVGRHRPVRPRRLHFLAGRYRSRLIAAIGVIGAAAIAIAFALATSPSQSQGQGGVGTTPGSYLGVYHPGSPRSYAGVTAFRTTTGVRPNLALYYSGWGEPFQAAFALQATAHGALPLVQIDPVRTRLVAIAAGKYDTYLAAYATAVRSYHHPVILSFGHEMNAWWYSWGDRHTSPAAFVAAWQHIVTIFRQQGASNVTWLWTVNVIDAHGHIPDPTPWWPGSAYVSWVGIDGYYHKSSLTFAPLFGPTIKAVRALTRQPIPILVAETGVTPDAGQPAKIADLFAGVRAYGLLGLVWFDAKDWRIISPASAAAFRRAATRYSRLTS
jgi:Glycosyl hydrolase family 26